MGFDQNSDQSKGYNRGHNRGQWEAELSPSSRRWWARLISGGVLLLLSAIAIIYLAARFVIWPNIDTFATRYVGTLQERIGVPVAWQAIRSQWDGFKPSLNIEGLVIGSGADALRADRLSATLSLRPLLAGRAEFSDLVIEAPFVALVRRGDQVALAALRNDEGARPASDGPLLGWLLAQPGIRIGGGVVTLAEEGDERRSRALRFERIAMVLKNDGQAHELRVDVGNAGALAAGLTFQAEVDRKPDADSSDWRNWAGSAQFEARQFQVDELLAGLPAQATTWLEQNLPAVKWSSVSGRIDPNAMLQFDYGRLVASRLKLRTDDLVATISDGRPLRFAQSSVELRLVPAATGGFEVSAPAFDVAEAGGARLRSALPALTLTLTENGDVRRLNAGVDAVEIGPSLALARRFFLEKSAAPDSVGAWLSRLSGAGRVGNLRVDWAPPTAFRASGELMRASISVTPTPAQQKNPLALRVPGFRNLSGMFELSEAGGKAALVHAAGSAARQRQDLAMISLGGLLAEPDVTLAELDARFSWSIDHAAGPQWLTVQVERLDLANDDLKGSATARYRSGGKGSGLIDLRAKVDQARAKQVWRYLPPELPESTRRWVRTAFEAGSYDDVDVRWAGDVRDFPYRLKAGAAADPDSTFRIGGRIRDTLFKFDPAWPAVQGVGGELVFERAGMRFLGERGAVADLQLSSVEARIDSFDSPLLALEGRVRGDAAGLLKYISESPLDAAIDGATRPIIATGPATLDLALRVPLGSTAPTTAIGNVEWSNGVFDYAPAGIRIEAVAGRIQFTEKSLTLPSLTGRLAGNLITVSGTSPAPGNLLVEAQGVMDVAGLREMVGDDPLLGQLTGATRYQATINVGEAGTRVEIESDLAGLASSLPSPMAKSVDVRWPLKLTVTRQPAANRDQIDASLRGEVRLIAERERADSHKPWQLARAALAVNREPVLPDSGIALQYTGQRLDLDEWMAVFDASPSGASPRLQSSNAAHPVIVALVVDEVRAAGRNFNRVVLGATRSGSRWRANLAAREINGSLDWSVPNLGAGLGAGKLTARLARLEVPRSQLSEAESLAAKDPTSLPALDVTADRFVYGGLDFGALTLRASNSAGKPPAKTASGATAGRAWKIERLRLASSAAEFEAQGEWNRTTSLNYRLNIDDAGALLNRLQLKGTVKGGKGGLTGRLEWAGAPTGVDLATLAGTVEIAVRDGQFLKVDPGAAKLIGVLNLQALPKLLALDFKDIFARGFSFEELVGNVDIERGVARTDNLAMRGLEAVVQIKGDADLRAETQNLHVTVLPELNGGLATLAFAAIVNPAVGLGAFLAQSVLSKPLARAFAYEIDVTGPWSEPNVVERRRNRIGLPAEGEGGR